MLYLNTDPVTHPLRLSPNLFHPHFDLRRPLWKFHTIFLHCSGCTSALSQHVAIIGPVVAAETKAINPFLLLFAPWLAVTGCSIIGPEPTCPLHFTLISSQLQNLIPARLRIPLLPPMSSLSFVLVHSHLSTVLHHHAGLILHAELAVEIESAQNGLGIVGVCCVYDHVGFWVCKSAS